MGRPILSNIPYNLDEVALASLVPNLKNPNQDALLTSQTLHKGVDFSIRNATNFHGNLASTDAKWLGLHLSRLILLLGQHAPDDSFHLGASEGRVYELKQPKARFRNLCGDLESRVRKWMQESIEDNQDSYLIFGSIPSWMVIKQSEKCSPEETFDIRINDLAEWL
ncbi:hypothetical protein OEA41_009814 [Lepraria neglecta]|uniref:Uncharacterized protein n=1 Tax=Lepraria neglecta TaxID=209136 RepID=A0AAE0DEQ6_9LECA|nr:hypothetical protein OEA41_009814 [Lepraria neglecta]